MTARQAARRARAGGHADIRRGGPGDDMRYVSAQIAHDDPRFTLKVYAQRRGVASGSQKRIAERTTRRSIRSWSVCLLLRRQQKPA
jgi:hypothetical protein